MNAPKNVGLTIWSVRKSEGSLVFLAVEVLPHRQGQCCCLFFHLFVRPTRLAHPLTVDQCGLDRTRATARGHNKYDFDPMCVKNCKHCQTSKPPLDYLQATPLFHTCIVQISGLHANAKLSTGHLWQKGFTHPHSLGFYGERFPFSDVACLGK